MYANYSYYKAGYLHKDTGLISEADFPAYAQQASMRIDYLTWGRVSDTLAAREEIKLCCCEMAEAIYRYDQARDNESAAPIVSWSNDGESGSYDISSSDITEEGHNRMINKIARKYLLRLGLLNRRC